MRGTWKPGASGATGAHVVQLLITLAALARGEDYLFGADSEESLGRIERAIPLEWWGALFAAAAFAILLGMVGRWWTPIIVGHGVTAGLYLAVVLGIAVQVGFGDYSRFWTGPLLYGFGLHAVYAAGATIRLWDERARVTLNGDG